MAMYSYYKIRRIVKFVILIVSSNAIQLGDHYLKEK
jgi:hypothetical protein